MGAWNRKSDAALKLQGSWRRDRHGRREEPATPEPDPVPRPPRGTPTDEREVWAELAVAVADRFRSKYLPSFRRLVAMAVDLQRLPADAPLTARARAQQALMSALSRWGLDPSGDANLGPLRAAGATRPALLPGPRRPRARGVRPRSPRSDQGGHGAAHRARDQLGARDAQGDMLPRRL